MCSSKVKCKGQNEDVETVVEESHTGQRHLQAGPRNIRDHRAAARVTPRALIILGKMSKKRSNRFECIQRDS